MEFTTRKEIVVKVFAKCIIFVQVSEYCPYGCHLQDVQVGSSTLLSGHPHECWLLCSCRIYNSTRGHNIHYRSTNESAQEVGRY